MKVAKLFINSFYLTTRWFLALFVFLPVSITIHCWVSLIRGIAVRQVYLNLGAQCFANGAGMKLNEQVRVLDRYEDGRPVYIKKYIVNIFYEFRNKKLTPRYSRLPMAKEKHLPKKRKEFVSDTASKTKSRILLKSMKNEKRG